MNAIVWSWIRTRRSKTRRDFVYMNERPPMVSRDNETEMVCRMGTVFHTFHSPHIMLIHTTNIISLLLLWGFKLPKQMGNSSLPAQLCYLCVLLYMAALDTAGHSPSANTSESHWWSHRLITLSFSIHTQSSKVQLIEDSCHVLSVDFLLRVS